MKHPTNQILTMAIALTCISIVNTCPAESNRAAAPTYPPLTLSDFTKKTGFDPGPEVKLEQSVVPGIYAFRHPNQNGLCAQFVTADLKLMANNKVKGWSHLANNSPLTDAEQSDIGQRMIESVSANLIHLGPTNKTPAFTLISAVDCPYCLRLEKKLIAQKIAYQVIPGALDPVNQPIAKAAWQSVDPSVAWAMVMSGRPISSPSASNGKHFPETDFEDIRCMAGAGTPRAIFPNGMVVFGADAIWAELRGGN